MCVVVCCVVLRELQCVPQCVLLPSCPSHRPCILQCVAVCCSVLQCVAVCCSVLQCVQCVAEYVDAFVSFASALQQCVAVCCSVLQHVVVRCNVLQCAMQYVTVLCVVLR